MRRFDLEQRVCGAITARRMIRFKLGAEKGAHLVVPCAVYLAAGGKIMLAGLPVDDPKHPPEKGAPKDYEVALFAELELTDHRFKPPAGFNSHAERYKAGVECALDRKEDEAWPAATD
jgi:hypothetical protein